MDKLYLDAATRAIGASNERIARSANSAATCAPTPASCVVLLVQLQHVQFLSTDATKVSYINWLYST